MGISVTAFSRAQAVGNGSSVGNVRIMVVFILSSHPPHFIVFCGYLLLKPEENFSLPAFC